MCGVDVIYPIFIFVFLPWGIREVAFGTLENYGYGVLGWAHGPTLLPRQLILAVGEAGQLGDRAIVQHKNNKQWLPPRQATAQAAKCSKNAQCILPQRSKRIYCM